MGQRLEARDLGVFTLQPWPKNMPWEELRSHADGVYPV
jgi:hypothetical protein